MELILPPADLTGPVARGREEDQTAADMWNAVLMVALMVLAGPAGAQSQLPPELHTVSAGMVTAHFGGEKPEDNFPLRFGVTDLWFTFAGDDQTYVFRPREELQFSDWQLDILSPDGQYVLLLQSHYGPYHIVATARLKEYLNGAEPDFLVSGERPGSSGSTVAGVHHDAKWTSPQSIEFSFSCCGTEDIVKFEIGPNKVECLRWRNATDLTKGTWKSCVRPQSKGPAADNQALFGRRP